MGFGWLLIFPFQLTPRPMSMLYINTACSAQGCAVACSRVTGWGWGREGTHTCTRGWEGQQWERTPLRGVPPSLFSILLRPPPAIQLAAPLGGGGGVTAHVDCGVPGDQRLANPSITLTVEGRAAGLLRSLICDFRFDLISDGATLWLGRDQLTADWRGFQCSARL